MPAGVAAVDTVAFFDELAAAMASEPEKYERLGDIDLELALVMVRPEGEPFRVRLSFHGITCDGVASISAGEERAADCWLEGSLEDWQAMFDNIAAHGHAVEQWTLNTLALFGDRIALHAGDSMGEDRFHRFNQTLQEFVDAAARVRAAA
jgi:hypothetical protein